MKFVLDTSAYSAFNRGDQRLKPWFQAKHQIIVPLIVMGELRAGFAAGVQRQANEQLLQRFLDAPNVETIGLTQSTTGIFADIYLSLRSRGKAIGTNDIWIAALALEASAPLLTLDGDFARVPGLKLAKV